MSLILDQKIHQPTNRRISYPLDGPIHLIDKITGKHGTIDVVNVNSNRVRIAFGLPDNVTILRDKVYLEDDS